MFAWSFKAFALTGRQGCVRNYPGRCPGLGASALSGRVVLTCETSVRIQNEVEAMSKTIALYHYPKVVIMILSGEFGKSR